MKVSISLEDFKEILSFLSKFQAEQLQSFTLKAIRNSLEGTFLSSTCAAKIRKEAKVEREGKFNLGMLGSLAKALKGFESGELMLERNNSCLILKSKHFLLRLNENTDEIVFPEITFQGRITVPIGEFKKALQISLPFAGGQLNSILLDCEEKKLRIVASDGYRLNYLELPVAEPFTWRALLPPSILSRLIRVLPNQGEASLLPAEKFLCISFENRIIAMGVLSEKYFDYQRILKKDDDFKPFKVSAEKLFQALSAGAAFADRIKFEFNRNELKLFVISEQGTLETQTQGQGSINLSIFFNPRFFMEAVEAFEDEKELELFVKSPSNKCEIRSSTRKHQHFLMPIHET